MKNIKQNIICFLIYGGFACCLAFVLITNLGNNEQPVLENKESESIAQSKEIQTDDKKILDKETESVKSYQVENNRNISNKNEVENTTNRQQIPNNVENVQTKEQEIPKEDTLEQKDKEIIKNEEPTPSRPVNTQQVKEESTTNKPINNTQVNKEPVKEEVKPVQKEEPVKVQIPSTSENKTNTSTKLPSKPIVENKPIVNKPVISNINKIVLIDKSNGATCAQAIEYFYEDSNYKYYFTCIKSKSMYVRVNGKEYGLVYALKNNIVTIKDLENNGYRFAKKAKNVQVK